jgi:2-amino-4-hydroxy-6-hydroxymethyldihydropteridine diphosphokinase
MHRHATRRYFLSLGSNLGDRAGTIDAALGALAQLPDATLRATAPIETAPMYVDDQPVFLNAAAELVTALAPDELLDAILAIERSFGRERSVRFGPRTLDIDIIAADDLVLETDRLTIPHPRMHERAFVLRPLVALAPDWVHPVVGRTAHALLDAIEADEEVA